jgi:hypothetical protein
VNAVLGKIADGVSAVEWNGYALCNARGEVERMDSSRSD